jgi:TonB-linked SusC/RagA family outer membrane protein
MKTNWIKSCHFQWSIKKILHVLKFTMLMLLIGVPHLAASQPKVVSGTVTEENGDPLLGATVVVKGTTVGTVTDLSGKFTLSVPADGEMLIFSYVGLATQEVEIGEQRIFNIILTSETLGLDEVVVVGYGVQKKESVVGAISNTTRETLERRGGVTNLSAALSGQLPGVTVMQRGGQPGRDEPVIFIRGLSSWNGGEPLLLVDGIERPINDIDVSEVESVSVLKDASATAVFGVKGANGVILITTRRGRAGKTTFSGSANFAVKTISRMPRVMDSYDQFDFINTMVENSVAAEENGWSFMTPQEIMNYYRKPQNDQYKYIFPNTDWVDILVKDFAADQRYNLNIRGGTDFVKYFGSIGYSHEGDIMNAPYNPRGYQPGFSYDRFNYRGNLDFRITRTTDLAVNISGFAGKRNFSHMFNEYQLNNIFTSLSPSSMVLRYEDGMYGRYYQNVGLHNPAAMLWSTGVAINNRAQMVSDFRLDQKLDFILKGLSTSARLSYDTYMISSGPNVNDGVPHSRELYRTIDPNIIFAETSEDSAKYINYIVGQGDSPQFNQFDYQMDPISYGNESVNENQLSRALFYQLSLSYNRSFSGNDFSLLMLMNRRENATGATFPSFREDWVSKEIFH